MSSWFLQVLALIFIFLKLTEQIDWSWWIVISPVLVPVTLGIVIQIAAFVVSTNKDKKIKSSILSEGGAAENVLH